MKKEEGLKLTKEEINEKYPRRAGYYYFPDGKVYASVTTILNIIAKPALISWAGRRCAEVALGDPSLDVSEVTALAFAKKKDKADIGTEIHRITEGVLRGTFDATSIGNMPDETRGYAEAYMTYLQTYNPKVLYTEQQIRSDEFGYAGTLDEIVNIGGLIYLIDKKTSKNIYAEVGLQLIAYKHAVIEMKLVDKIDKMACLLLKPDGTLKFEEFDAPIEAFLSAKKLWEYFNPREVK